jgi:hypothetical protein
VSAIHVYFVLKAAMSQSYAFAGQAVRGAQDVGLHRSLAIAGISTVQQQHRQRVWWCVYGLDKLVSISLGRPSGITDDDWYVSYVRHS